MTQLMMTYAASEEPRMDAQKALEARALFGAVLLLDSNAARAHSFIVEYTLPLPFSLYAGGAAAALVLSFIAFGLVNNPAARSLQLVEVSTRECRVSRTSWPCAVKRLQLPC
jgi:hypothetical protein